MGLEKGSWVMTLWLPLAGCVSWTGLCTPLGWGLIILSTLLLLEAITYGRFVPKSKLLLGCRSLGFPLGFPSWPISKTPSCVPRGVDCLYIVRFLSPLSSDREQLVNVSGEGAGFELALKGQLGSRGGGGGRRSRKRQRRQPLHRPLPQGTLQHQAKLILRDRRRGGRAVLF